MKGVKKTTVEPIAVEGYVPIAIFIALTILVHYENFGHLTQVIILAITVFLIWFFRNPERISDDDSINALLAPVDGAVETVDKTKDATYITIHTKLKDAHIIRAPIESRLSFASVRHGAFLSVDSDKAALLNESYVTNWNSVNGVEYSMSFTLGSSPAKILLYPEQDKTVRAGERIAFVKSEIKTVIKLPSEAKVSVSAGDKLQAGKSVIGYEPATEQL